MHKNNTRRVHHTGNAPVRLNRLLKICPTIPQNGAKNVPLTRENVTDQTSAVNKSPPPPARPLTKSPFPLHLRQQKTRRPRKDDALLNVTFLAKAYIIGTVMVMGRAATTTR